MYDAFKLLFLIYIFPFSLDPPFTIENIFPHLLSLASKWQALGEALSLDEDCLDEIFTNNESDEACLHVMLELYMERCGLKHSWEEIREAIRKVEEKDRGIKDIYPSSQESLGTKPLDAGKTVATINYKYILTGC